MKNKGLNIGVKERVVLMGKYTEWEPEKISKWGTEKLLDELIHLGVIQLGFQEHEMEEYNRIIGNIKTEIIKRMQPTIRLYKGGR